MKTRKQQDLTTKKIEIGVSCYNGISATNHFGYRIIYGTCDYYLLLYVIFYKMECFCSSMTEEKFFSFSTYRFLNILVRKYYNICACVQSTATLYI